MDRLTLTRIVKERQLPLLLSATRRLVTPMYRAAFLAAAARSGVLGRLAVRPCDLQTLAHSLDVDQHAEELRTWLDIGVRLGDLAWFDDTYRLRSRTAKALARPGREPVAAALEEVLRFHLPVLMEAPQMLREGRKLSLSDQDGQVIARSTRVVEPFVEEAVRRTLDRDRPLRLLEVGCGAGTYVRLAAQLNPRLTALAIDLQDEVAAEAAENMAVWGLAGRVETRQGDLRTLTVEPQFDLVTLHNNIYYFPPGDRVDVLRKARSLLAPGGRLLLTTACRGGNLGLEVLNLWFTHADFGGPLPTVEDLVRQLDDAGFAQVTTRRLIPGDQFHAVVGVNAPAGRP
ncbi:class I SAM-dependent methyltransferase [Catenulispora sp. NF23]|uniref:SAM-dependent methyltransferase n=1 Tax=Catenulispora pinistramenti TaxID=2705254 RepID=UPI001BAD4B64|nr:class I SAM-dependent methyltransferase [Catenulispora pinistramenti]MBS2534577.1 class I SAM-dependent methyltransferase [Catenulispora pinistramenti]